MDHVATNRFAIAANRMVHNQVRPAGAETPREIAIFSSWPFEEMVSCVETAARLERVFTHRPSEREGSLPVRIASGLRELLYIE
jgi:hypothetical protein